MQVPHLVTSDSDRVAGRTISSLAMLPWSSEASLGEAVWRPQLWRHLSYDLRLTIEHQDNRKCYRPNM